MSENAKSFLYPNFGRIFYKCHLFYGRVPSFLVPFPNKQFAIISESSVNYFRISIHSPHPSQVYLNDQRQGF